MGTSENRCLRPSSEGIHLSLWFQRKFEDKRGALAGTLTLGDERASHFFRSQGTAMEAETVSGFAGGEAVVKDAGKVLGGNADAIIGDGDPDAVVAVGDADGELLLFISGFV